MVIAQGLDRNAVVKLRECAHFSSSASALMPKAIASSSSCAGEISSRASGSCATIRSSRSSRSLTRSAPNATSNGLVLTTMAFQPLEGARFVGEETRRNAGAGDPEVDVAHHEAERARFDEQPERREAGDERAT